MKLRFLALAALLLSGFGLTLTAHAGPVIPPQPGCGVSVTGFTVSAAGEVTNGDSNFTIPSTASWAATSATLTASRVWTVPAASTYAAGCELTISDPIGAVSSGNTLTLVPTGGDTFSGQASLPFLGPRASATLKSNGGAGGWTIKGADQLQFANSCPSGWVGIAVNAFGPALTCAQLSLTQLSGQLLCSQMPALSGGVTSSAGGCPVSNPAFLPPPWQSFSVNSSYMPGAFNVGGTTTAATLNTASQFFSYVVSPGSYTISGIGVFLTTAQTGGNARMCIYSSTATGLPGTLLADFGTVSLATGAGAMAVSAGTTLAVTPGEALWIDVGIAATTTAPTLVGWAPTLGWFPETAGQVGGVTNPRGYMTSTFPTSGCASTAPTVTQNSTGSNQTPLPWIKVQ